MNKIELYTAIFTPMVLIGLVIVSAVNDYFNNKNNPKIN